MSFNPPVMRGILIGCVVLASLAVGFTMPLVALSLNADGLSSTLVGLNAAAPALGILTITLFTNSLVSKLGLRGAMFGSAAVFVVLVLLLPQWRGFWPWFFIRYLIGLSTGVFWVVAETWLNATTPNAIRGRIFGLYGSLSAVGLALGPLLIVIWGTDGAWPFQVVALIFACAAIIARVLPAATVRVATFQSIGYFAAMKFAPRAMLAACVSGFLVTVQIVLLPIYAARENLSADSGAAMLTAVLIGAVMCQLVVGWLIDRIGRNHVLTVAAIATSLSAAGLWLCDVGVLQWPLLALWGGAGAALYSVALVMIGDQFETASLAAAGAALHGAYHLGNIIGPALVGYAMDYFGPSALLGVCGLTSGIFAAVSGMRRFDSKSSKAYVASQQSSKISNSLQGGQHED